MVFNYTKSLTNFNRRNNNHINIYINNNNYVFILNKKKILTFKISPKYFYFTWHKKSHYMRNLSAKISPKLIN